MFDYIALGARIRTSRTKAGMTQEQLGEATGLSTAFIGHIERGTRKLSVESLVQIASCLSVSVDYLLLDMAQPDNLFSTISAKLAATSAEKQKAFLTMVKAMAEKIDEI